MRKLIIPLALATLALAGCSDDGGNGGVGASASAASEPSPQEQVQDRAAQSDLRNAFAAAKVNYTDDETYTSATPDMLETIEPSLEFDFVANAAEDVIGVDEQSSTDILLVTQSKSGTFFCIAETSTGTNFGYAYELAGVQTIPKCEAAKKWADPIDYSYTLVDDEEYDYDDEYDDEYDAEYEGDYESDDAYDNTYAGIDLGDEDEFEPVELMLNGIRNDSLSTYTSAWRVTDCPGDTIFDAELEYVVAAEPKMFTATLESTGPDTATVTVYQDGVSAHVIDVIFDTGLWWIAGPCPGAAGAAP